MNKQVTLRISILGGIWWPMGLLCLKNETIRLGKNPFEVDIEPVLADIEDYVFSHFVGDFSGVSDWQCEMESTHWEGNKRITEFSTPKEWNSEENELMYFDTIAEYVE